MNEGTQEQEREEGSPANACCSCEDMEKILREYTEVMLEALDGAVKAIIAAKKKKRKAT